MMTTKFYRFYEFDLATLYDVLALRNQVFIVEQKCPYPDLDYLDQLAWHMLVHDDNKLIAYARILSKDNQTVSFGRLITATQYRGKKLGKQLMEKVLSFIENNYHGQDISITAQSYLINFYQRYGFKPLGAAFDLDGISHTTMVKKP